MFDPPTNQTSTPAYVHSRQPDIDALVYRQIQIMQAAGWTLERHWPGGADFVSRESSSISVGVHLLLVLFTVGLWLPVMVIMELASSGTKRTRLTIDENGQPQYTTG